MSERIEYIPPGLKHILTDVWAGKRFKNRDGYAVLQQGDTEFNVQGNMLDIHRQAIEHVGSNKTNSAIVYEHRCYSSGEFIRKLDS